MTDRIQPTVTASARDKGASYARYFCVRSHAHRSEAAALACEAAWSRKVKRMREIWDAGRRDGISDAEAANRAQGRPKNGPRF